MPRALLYAVDESFFDKIETEEQAYWLGFLTADGYVKEWVVVLNIDSKDYDHVAKFKAAIKSEHPIHVYEDTRFSTPCGSANLSIGSRKLVAALDSLGLHVKRKSEQSKTFTVKPCEKVPEQLLRHYWRGVFDGDGCICKHTVKGLNAWAVSLVCNLAIVDGFRSFVSQFVTSRATSRNCTVGVVAKQVAYYGTNLPAEVLHLLYDGATVYLDCKKAKADDLFQHMVGRRKRHMGLTKEVLQKAYDRYRTWAEVSRILKVSRDSLLRARRRLGMGLVYPYRRPDLRKHF